MITQVSTMRIVQPDESASNAINEVSQRTGESPSEVVRRLMKSKPGTKAKKATPANKAASRKKPRVVTLAEDLKDFIGMSRNWTRGAPPTDPRKREIYEALEAKQIRQLRFPKKVVA